MRQYGKKYFLLWSLCLLSAYLAGCSSLKSAGQSTELQEETELSSGQIAETEDLEGSAETSEIQEVSAEVFGIPEKSRDEILQDKAAEYLDEMTIEEKAAQLFIVLPESLMEDVGSVTEAGPVTKEAIWETPVGGFIYMEPNLESPEQVTSLLENVQKFSRERTGLPMFLCVDEEGGAVARIAGSGKFDVPVFGDMAETGQRQDAKEAYEIGTAIGGYLFDLGFNVDFAPVADVWTNPENQVVKRRAFGSDADIVSDLANAAAEGLQSQGIMACLKHFPGHGNTSSDTHAGYAYTDKTKEELFQCELIPFAEGIEKEIPFIMVGHISLPHVTDDDTPASLSPVIMTDLLRKEMGYDGIIITDAFNMGAVVKQYSSGEAAIKSLIAGADMILMPEDFMAAYHEVILAMKDGRLSAEQVDASLMRILKRKLEWMEGHSGEK